MRDVQFYDKAKVDALLSEKAGVDDLTPLSEKTYDLSRDGEFLRMCVDIARALGATVTNDLEKAAQP